MTHYFENDPHLKSHEIKRKVIIHNHSFSFYTDDGVFSKRGLDFGTRTLLENLELSKIQGDVLDFGCGYGPIAIFLAKETSASIDAVDINKRSIALAKKNAILNQVVIDVWESDIYSNVSKKYDFIITNPPIRVGKKILYQILKDSDALDRVRLELPHIGLNYLRIKISLSLITTSYQLQYNFQLNSNIFK